jgi:hypothetical protein
MTLLCRDEEDIVGYNIAYHLAQGVDFVIATDNASQDRTPQLLERFARQGKLHLIREPSLTHDQGTWVTRMARMAAKRFDADWIINADADEFWLSRTGSLRDALAAIPSSAGCLAVPHFDMLPPRLPQSQFFEAMVLRRADGKTVYGRDLEIKVCHRAFDDIKVADGNHFVLRRGTRVPEYWDHPLEYLHFPIRSVAQLERKVRQGAEALSANTRLKPGIGSHWHKLYRDHYQKGSLDQFYDACAPAPEQIDSGIASGALAIDTRVRDALRRIGSGTTAPC